MEKTTSDEATKTEKTDGSVLGLVNWFFQLFSSSFASSDVSKACEHDLSQWSAASHNLSDAHRGHYQQFRTCSKCGITYRRTFS